MRKWLKLLILGVLCAIFGIFVLANPPAASLAIEQVVGFLFLVIGGFQIYAALHEERFGAKAASLLLGALAALLGVSFLINPLEGVLSLVTVVIALLAVSGLVRIALAWRMKNTRFYWSMLLSGALSALLALYLIANFGAISTSLLGVLMGIEMILDGFAMIVLAFVARATGKGNDQP